MGRTKIDWADMTWNPVWGCKNHCSYCYARRMAKRIARRVATKEIKHLYPGEERPREWLELYEKLRNFEPVFLYSNLERLFPKKPSRIFVNSMSDIAFWEDAWWKRVAEKIKQYPQHQYLFLTKQPASYIRLHQHKVLPPNCWFGTTITKRDFPQMVLSASHINFISIEPILEHINLHERQAIQYLKWIIVGAETGNRKGRVIPELSWIQNLVDYARTYNIPIWLKENLRDIWPSELIQELPEGGRA